MSGRKKDEGSGSGSGSGSGDGSHKRKSKPCDLSVKRPRRSSTSSNDSDRSTSSSSSSEFHAVINLTKEQHEPRAAAQQNLPVDKSTPPVGRPTLPVGRPIQPVGRPTLPVGRPSQPVRRPTLPVGRATLPVGRPIQPVGRPTLPVARPTQPVRRPTLPVGRPTLPVGRPTLPVGRPIQPVGRPTLPVDRPALPAEPLGSVVRPLSVNKNPVIGEVSSTTIGTPSPSSVVSISDSGDSSPESEESMQNEERQDEGQALVTPPLPIGVNEEQRQEFNAPVLVQPPLPAIPDHMVEKRPEMDPALVSPPLPIIIMQERRQEQAIPALVPPSLSAIRNEQSNDMGPALAAALPLVREDVNVQDIRQSPIPCLLPIIRSIKVENEDTEDEVEDDIQPEAPVSRNSYILPNVDATPLNSTLGTHGSAIVPNVTPTFRQGIMQQDMSPARVENSAAAGSDTVELCPAQVKSYFNEVRPDDRSQEARELQENVTPAHFPYYLHARREESVEEEERREEDIQMRQNLTPYHVPNYSQRLHRYDSEEDTLLSCTAQYRLLTSPQNQINEMRQNFFPFQNFRNAPYRLPPRPQNQMDRQLLGPQDEIEYVHRVMTPAYNPYYQLLRFQDQIDNMPEDTAQVHNPYRQNIDPQNQMRQVMFPYFQPREEAQMQQNNMLPAFTPPLHPFVRPQMEQHINAAPWNPEMAAPLYIPFVQQVIAYRNAALERSLRHNNDNNEELPPPSTDKMASPNAQ